MSGEYFFPMVVRANGRPEKRSVRRMSDTDSVSSQWTVQERLLMVELIARELMAEDTTVEAARRARLAGVRLFAIAGADPKVLEEYRGLIVSGEWQVLALNV
jgi:hypothetical protein